MAKLISKINISKETINLIVSWLVLFSLWLLFGLNEVGNWLCINDRTRMFSDFYISIIRAFISAMLFLIPLLQIININKKSINDGEKERTTKANNIASCIMLALSGAIIYIGKNDFFVLICVIIVCFIINFVFRIVFGKEVWSRTGGLVTFSAILFLNSTTLLSTLFLLYNPIKLLIFIAFNLSLVFIFNFINRKFKMIKDVHSPIVLLIIISIIFLTMVLLFYNNTLENLYFNGIYINLKVCDGPVNYLFLYSLLYIVSYYLFSRFCVKEFFLFNNNYDESKNYYYMAMNNLFNFIVLIIAFISLRLFKIEILENNVYLKDFVELIKDNRNEFDSFALSFVDAIGIVLIIITYLSIRKDSNEQNDKGN